MARIAAASVALASVTAMAVAGVAERASVADSFRVLGRLHWLWIPAALVLESASMAACSTASPASGWSRWPGG